MSTNNEIIETEDIKGEQEQPETVVSSVAPPHSVAAANVKTRWFDPPVILVLVAVGNFGRNLRTRQRLVNCYVFVALRSRRQRFHCFGELLVLTELDCLRDAVFQYGEVFGC